MYKLLPYVIALLEQRNDSNKSVWSSPLTSKPLGVHTPTLRPKRHSLGKIHSCWTSGGPTRLRIWKNLGLHFQMEFQGLIEGSHMSLDTALISWTSSAFLWLPRVWPTEVSSPSFLYLASGQALPHLLVCSHCPKLIQPFWWGGWIPGPTRCPVQQLLLTRGCWALETWLVWLRSHIFVSFYFTLLTFENRYLIQLMENF